MIFPNQNYLDKGNDQGDMKKDHMIGIFMNHRRIFQEAYFEAVDLITNCILNRFDQPGYKRYSFMESLLMKSCKGEEFEGILNNVCSFNKDNFDRDLLCTQLQTFQVHYRKEHG